MQVMRPPRTPRWDPSVLPRHKRPVLVSYIGSVQRVNRTGGVKSGSGVSALWKVKLAVRALQRTQVLMSCQIANVSACFVRRRSSFAVAPGHVRLHAAVHSYSYHIVAAEHCML